MKRPQMKRVTLTIDTQNAAFDPDPYSEVVRILENITERFRNHTTRFEPVMDENGNKVGTVKVDWRYIE